MQLLFVCLYLMFDEGAIMELFNSDVINTWVTETSKIISGAMSLFYLIVHCPDITILVDWA